MNFTNDSGSSVNFFSMFAQDPNNVYFSLMKSNAFYQYDMSSNKAHMAKLACFEPKTLGTETINSICLESNKLVTCSNNGLLRSFTKKDNIFVHDQCYTNKFGINDCISAGVFKVICDQSGRVSILK